MSLRSAQARRPAAHRSSTMDRFLYVSMSGAKETLRAQAVEQPQPREREHDGVSRRISMRFRRGQWPVPDFLRAPMRRMRQPAGMQAGCADVDGSRTGRRRAKARLDCGAGRRRSRGLYACGRSARRSERHADERRGTSGDGRHRSAQRSSQHVDDDCVPTAPFRSCRWVRGRRPVRSSVASNS